jgi:RNA polymerase sigma-70 factor, ECF subfamily
MRDCQSLRPGAVELSEHRDDMNGITSVERASRDQLVDSSIRSLALKSSRPFVRCGRGEDMHPGANMQMFSRKASPRGSCRVEAPAVEVVQRFGEGVVGRAGAASDAGTQGHEALLRACASGDRTALHSLYRRTAPRLFGLARRILKSRELAEEVVQDSFLLVWHNAHAFDASRGAGMAWLASIVRNQCIAVLRQRGRETPLDAASIEDREDPVAGPAELVALSHDARRLQYCLGELEEGPRKLLKLVYYEGMTYKEAAAHVGEPLGTVKSWVRRSLVRLKGCMER